MSMEWKKYRPELISLHDTIPLTMNLGLTSLLLFLLVPILLLAWVGVAAGLVYVLRDSEWWDNPGCLITLLIVTFPWGLIAYFFLRSRDSSSPD